MTLSEELIARGFIYQCSHPSLAEVFDGESRTIFLGVDPTATAIHVGNLAPFMLLNRLAQAGHRVIILIGGATALIGDPSGRDKERDFVSKEEVAERAAAIEKQIRSITTFPAVFVNNYDWLAPMTLVEFLRDVGKHFTVNSLIKKDAIATRMESESGISYTEFSYNLLQSYDFYHLYTQEQCTVQIGGSDQWGNIIGGVEYVRRLTGSEVFGVTMPLIVDKATGKKFGKSMGNAVWLDETLTTPYELYQFWLNTSDESVIDYLKIFTSLTLPEIADIEAIHAGDPSARVAQTRLAEEVVRFIHGAEKLAAATLATDVLFGRVMLSELTADQLDQIAGMVSVQIIASGTSLVDMLLATNLATSKREAREFIEAGAISIQGTVVTDIMACISTDMYSVGLLMVTRGKKHRALIAMQ